MHQRSTTINDLSGCYRIGESRYSGCHRAPGRASEGCEDELRTDLIQSHRFAAVLFCAPLMFSRR
jgi:hypothetical protein